MLHARRSSAGAWALFAHQQRVARFQYSQISCRPERQTRTGQQQERVGAGLQGGDSPCGTTTCQMITALSAVPLDIRTTVKMQRIIVMTTSHSCERMTGAVGGVKKAEKVSARWRKGDRGGGGAEEHQRAAGLSETSGNGKEMGCGQQAAAYELAGAGGWQAAMGGTNEQGAWATPWARNIVLTTTAGDRRRERQGWRKGVSRRRR